MPIDELKETLRSNGEVVIGALKKMKGPATIKDVVEYLATNNELDPTKIRAPVREILNTGYYLGFLSKKGTKFALDQDDPPSPTSSNEPSDRSRSRSRSRRRRSRSRRRRSRSRRRRRR